MNLILFFILLALFFLVIYVKYMLCKDHETYNKRFFWGFGIAAILFAAIFNGVLDRIFILLFAIFMIFARFVLAIWET